MLQNSHKCWLQILYCKYNRKKMKQNLKIFFFFFFWRWQPKVQQLIEQLAEKLSSRTTDVKISTVTQPKEFNLTVPKPRAIPVPLPIQVLEKSPPVSFFMLCETLWFVCSCAQNHGKQFNGLFHSNCRKSGTFDRRTRIHFNFSVTEGQIPIKITNAFHFSESCISKL